MRIKSIKKIEHNSKRYDFEVLKNSNFIANGVVVHNSSMTIYYNRGDYGVCSRNYDIKESDLPASQEPNSFWKVAKEKGIIDKLKELEVNVALQGELIGPGVQKNKYKLTQLDLRIFDVFNIDKGHYFDHNDAKEFLSKHFPLLNWVPHVMDYTLNEDTTVEELLGYAEGKSALNPQQEREGLVWRPKTETFDIRFGRVAFKTISNRFLLKCED